MPLRSSYLRIGRLLGFGTSVGLLLLAGGWTGRARSDGPGGAEDFWKVGVPRPIAVRGGRATFRVTAGGPGSQTLVVVSALARGRGPFPVRLEARPVSGAAVPELDLADPRHRAVPGDRVRTAPASSPAAPVLSFPPRERLFHLMVREGDPGSPSNYVAVRGVLKGVGHQVQIYVASEDLDRVAPGTLEDLIATFDDRVHRLACALHGPARDVDGDGRFTILLSSWLEHLGGGRYPVDGFVKVADLDPSVPAPFGNRCDMMYLNAGMASGPYLRTVLAHEYTHAAVYTRKALEQGDEDGPGPEEEGWLDEAMAHLVEDLHGFSTSNIDYRVSAFLSRPERYQLVVADYFASDLFRSHGNRGGTYLFLRWCADRYGPELVSALIRSPRRGIASIEAATGSTFEALFRRWSVGLFLSGMDPEGPPECAGDGFRSVQLRAPWAEGEMAGPRFVEVEPGGPADRWEASGTTTHYAVIEGHGTDAVEVEVVGPPDADLQVTAVPLGEGRARISLSIRAVREPGGAWALRAVVAEHNGVPVRLSGLSWEPLVPGPRPRAEGRRPAGLERPGVVAAFGTSALPARGELRSRPITLPGLGPEDGPIVVKAVGTDPRGRRVSAWAEVAVGSPDRHDQP